MVLAFKTGRDAAFWIANGSDNDLTNEPLQEVDLSAEGYARYTVYEVADATKRYLNDNETPVVQFDTAGDNNFQAVTPAEIQYAGGRILLSTPRGATDVGRIASGHYLTPTQYLGAMNYRLEEEWITDEVMCLGDQAPRTLLIAKRWSGSVEGYWCKSQATLVTNMAGDDNDIVLTHEPGGTEGHDISLELVDPGAENPTIDVAVTGKAIVVTLACNAVPAITTTASQLVAALNASEAVLRLGVTAALKSGNTGAGIVTALAHTHLSGGADQVDWGSETSKVIGIFYKDYDDDVRQEGYCVISNFVPDTDPNKAIRTKLDIKGTGPLYRRSG